MDAPISVLLAAVGLGLVLVFAERLVKALAGLALGLRVSTFLLSVIFLGFDPENLAVGAVGTFEGASGLALGSIIGAAMVAIGLAFGITALVAPMRFEQAPWQVLVVPIVAVALFGVLAVDGQLSRMDGVLLLAGYIVALLYLTWLSRRGIDIQARSGVAEELVEARELGKAKAAALLVLSLAAITIGSELLVTGASDLIGRIGLSQTVFGMTVLALLVSIEEVAREVPAAMKGHAEISYGNVNGSALGFFLLNAGLVALVRPFEIDRPTLAFYLPILFVTLVVVSAFLIARQVPRWAGATLIFLYVVFEVGGYLLFSHAPVGG